MLLIGAVERTRYDHRRTSTMIRAARVYHNPRLPDYASPRHAIVVEPQSEKRIALQGARRTHARKRRRVHFSRITPFESAYEAVRLRWFGKPPTRASLTAALFYARLEAFAHAQLPEISLRTERARPSTLYRTLQTLTSQPASCIVDSRDLARFRRTWMRMSPGQDTNPAKSRGNVSLRPFKASAKHGSQCTPLPIHWRFHHEGRSRAELP